VALGRNQGGAIKLGARESIFDRLDRKAVLRLPKPMDALTLFGLAAVTAMLVFYALEDRNRW
jgi:hypothetical protein